MDAAIGKRKDIKIFGNDYDTPDKTCIRDYIHINDIAQAHVLAMEWLQKYKKDSAHFNLGNAEGFSVKEIIAVAEKVTGRKIPTVISPRRAGDTARLIASNSKAKKTLGWKPQIPDIENIVQTAWQWHQKLNGLG